MISYIVPTIGRESLKRTLESIEVWPGDEVLIVGEGTKNLSWIVNEANYRFINCPRGNDWGHTERNWATPLARKRYIAHIDDDDVYAPGARAHMADAIKQTPGRPIIFRMRAPNGVTLWQDKEVRCGNLGTPCFLIPNMPTKMGVWGSFVGGDCAFLESSKWAAEDYVWREEVICLVGHNWGE